MIVQSEHVTSCFCYVLFSFCLLCFENPKRCVLFITYLQFKPVHSSTVLVMSVFGSQGNLVASWQCRGPLFALIVWYSTIRLCILDSDICKAGVHQEKLSLSLHCCDDEPKCESCSCIVYLEGEGSLKSCCSSSSFFFFSPSQCCLD